MKRWFVCLSASLLFVACGKSTADYPTIAIGAVIDRTGTNAEPSWADAIKLAELHMNKALLDSNKDLQFNIIINDSENEPTIAVTRALDLVQQRGVKALMGDTSTNSVALNKTNYDADASNNLNVPIQCGGCTAGTINNPTATNADPVEQEALRNGQKWLFRSIMSTKLISKVIVRLLLAEGVNGDVNGDGLFKLAVYQSDETFGNGTANDLNTFATTLHPTPASVRVERIKHPRDADPNTYDWASDIDLLVNNFNETTQTADGYPDAIVVVTFAQYYVSFVNAYKSGGQTIRLMHVHTFRISSVATSLGGLAEGQEGVSHVLLDNGASGDTFAQEYRGQYSTEPAYRDSIYYDNAVTLMLGALIASRGMGDPTQVTGTQIRDALPLVADVATPGQVVRTGVPGLVTAISLITEGSPINYEGASGPMDYDANQNVRDRLAHYRAVSGQFVDLAKFDCVADDNCTEQ